MSAPGHTPPERARLLDEQRMIVGQPKVVTFAVSGAPGTRDAFQAAGRAMHDKLDEPAVVDLQLLSVTQRIMCDDPAKVGPLVWNFSATVRSK